MLSLFGGFVKVNNVEQCVKIRLYEAMICHKGSRSVIRRDESREAECSGS